VRFTAPPPVTPDRAPRSPPIARRRPFSERSQVGLSTARAARTGVAAEFAAPPRASARFVERTPSFHSASNSHRVALSRRRFAPRRRSHFWPDSRANSARTSTDDLKNIQLRSFWLTGRMRVRGAVEVCRHLPGMRGMHPFSIRRTSEHVQNLNREVRTRRGTPGPRARGRSSVSSFDKQRGGRPRGSPAADRGSEGRTKCGRQGRTRRAYQRSEGREPRRAPATE